MTTRPRPFAFVLMPFSREFDDAYQLAIKPACESAGAYAERVDEQVFSGSILDRIYNQIAKADVVVADMSGRNANVFYEVGYAHALGKTTVLVTKSAEDIPFDLKHFPHIVYGSSLVELRTKLEGTVRWHIENPTRSEEVVADLRVRVNGVYIADNTEVPITVNKGAFGVTLAVEVENHAAQVVSTVDFRTGFLLPAEFDPITHVENYGTREVQIDPLTRLCLVGPPHTLLPGEWAVLSMPLTRGKKEFAAGEALPLVLRIFRQSGTRDYAFHVRIQHK